MRGFIARSDGVILPKPMIGSFIEGISVGEYVNAAHGARKGLSDTALKTANDGYFNWRLISLSQDTVVRSFTSPFTLQSCTTAWLIVCKSYRV